VYDETTNTLTQCITKGFWNKFKEKDGLIYIEHSDKSINSQIACYNPDTKTANIIGCYVGV
jgi:hypothetical protein